MFCFRGSGQHNTHCVLVNEKKFQTVWMVGHSEREKKSRETSVYTNAFMTAQTLRKDIQGREGETYFLLQETLYPVYIFLFSLLNYFNIKTLIKILKTL